MDGLGTHVALTGALAVVTDTGRRYDGGTLVAQRKPAGSEGVTMTATTSTDVATVERAYELFRARDIPGVLALFAPRIRWTEAAGSAYPGTQVGPDAVLQNVFARLGEDWESFVPDVEECADLGGRVLALGWFTGTHAGTGRSMRARFAHLFTVADGRITAFESINDTAAVLNAMS